MRPRKPFNNVCRAKKLPEATAKASGIESIAGENKLEVRNEGDETHLYLSGSVGASWFDEGGITEKEVRDALKSIKRGKPITVHVNSEGGSIKEGIGIYNAFKERGDDITCHVDGYALSIASVFPLACGKVVSPKSAIWMIHNAWSWASGNAADMEAQAEMLREHDRMLNEIYQEHTGKTEDEIREAMDAETWIRGSQAVEWGLADESDDDDADDTQDSYGALPQAWLDRCRNIPENILNALRVPPATANGATPTATAPAAANDSGATTSAPHQEGPITAVAGDNNSEGTKAEEIPAAVESAAQTHNKHMPETNTPAAAQPTAPDALAQIAALKERLITNRVQTYVDAQKITKAEVPLFVKAALTDEEGTFKILDEKAVANAATAPVSGGDVFVSHEPNRFESRALNRYKVLGEKSAKARYAGLRQDWNQMIADALKQDDVMNAHLTRQNIMPLNSNTYSATLVTSFLTDGATTILQNRLAPLRAFSRDFSTDPYKPNAVAQHKYVSSGPTVQTDASTFESGNSTVAPISITPHQYSSSIQVSNADLNNGLRMENLVTIATAALGNKIIEVATAPITLANYATDWTGGSVNVVTAANFGFDDLGLLWGYLQKSPVKNLILDGTYLAKLLNQPTYFQKYAEDEGAWKAFGWDLIALCSDWTGASNNAVGFACNPQAIALLAGLPLTPPTGIPGNTLQTGVFTLPGVELSVQTNSWFALASRTAWMSYDVILGAAKMDATAGLVICSS